MDALRRRTTLWRRTTLPVDWAKLAGREAADTDAHSPGGQRNEVGQPTVTVPLTAELYTRGEANEVASVVKRAATCLAG